MTPQQWYYRKGTARFGPVSGSDIKKMAAEGKLAPTDLLRGVGMTEWIPASKIKGLFAKPVVVPPATSPTTPKAKQSVADELSLAPLESAVPTTAPVAKPKVNVAQTAKPAAKPTVKPVTPTTAATVPQVFATPDVSNPFAQFGLEATPAMPNLDFGASPNMFDNLAALEKQSQAIYREPTVAAEPDPFAAKKAKTSTASSASDFGPAAYFGFMAAPFLFVLLVCFPIGVITAWVPLRIIAIAIAVGTSKMVGLVAGSCMLKVKIKNEVLALGYGGLVGFFVTYVFIAASFWTYINVSAYLWKMPQHKLEQSAPREIDEDGRSLVLQPDEQPQFPDPDQPPPPQAIAEENNDEEEKEKMEGEGNDNAKSGEDEEQTATEMEPETEWSRNNNADMKQMQRMQDRMELIERLFGKGISFFESVLPLTLLKFVRVEVEFNPVGYLFYWLLMGGILVAITAHSTWMANLGSDPTSNSGF